jgi:hypothetical protein
MSREAWETLVVRYAAGREICNCRQAYYTPAKDEEERRRYGERSCASGCQANQYAAREEIARRVLEELDSVLPPATRARRRPVCGKIGLRRRRRR